MPFPFLVNQKIYCFPPFSNILQTLQNTGQIRGSDSGPRLANPAVVSHSGKGISQTSENGTSIETDANPASNTQGRAPHTPETKASDMSSVREQIESIELSASAVRIAWHLGEMLLKANINHTSRNGKHSALRDTTITFCREWP